MCKDVIVLSELSPFVSLILSSLRNFASRGSQLILRVCPSMFGQNIASARLDEFVVKHNLNDRPDNSGDDRSNFSTSYSPSRSKATDDLDLVSFYTPKVLPLVCVIGRCSRRLCTRPFEFQYASAEIQKLSH